VQMINPFAPDRLSANLLNRSKGGVCLATATFLPPGGEVQVLLRVRHLFGTVRYCVAMQGGFRAGIAVSRVIEAPVKSDALGQSEFH
jgi:hypothetical protein